MNDAYPSRRSTDKPPEKRTLLERLTDFISHETRIARRTSRSTAKDAHQRNLLDAGDSLSMIEGAYSRFPELCARDIMIPRAQDGRHQHC